MREMVRKNDTMGWMGAMDEEMSVRKGLVYMGV